MLTKNLIKCDLCVIGGGIAGMCSAISGAREGLKVVLMHERPVLGGNASSEIRMWICGANGENNRETGILEEIALENLYRNPTKNYAIWDSVLFDFVKREENITLLLNCTCMDAETIKGNFKDNRNKKIKSITGYQMTTQSFFRVESKYYCDSSGDSILAPLTNANFRIGREAKNEFNEDTSVLNKDSMTMGMSCLIQGRETSKEISFTPPTWSTKLTKKDFEHRNPDIYNDSENFWYLELGGNKDSIKDTESVRDELVSLALGTWDYIKNSGEFNAKNWELDFLGFLPGKRESRRMCGEYTITQKDISSGKVFEDEIAFGGWSLDDHYPGGFYHKGKPNSNVPTPSPYSIPLRSLYSNNVENLFFAGRNISMTHLAMSSVRVMATCGLLGEAVGKATYVCVKENLSPNEVYKHKINIVQNLLLNEDCFLPSKTRNISNACKTAKLINGDDILRNGQDRPHKIYNTNDKNAFFKAPLNSRIVYELESETTVKSVHIVFDSDLNRKTLPGSKCEQIHSTRANTKLDSPQMTMPKTLCKEFKLMTETNGETQEILHIINNRKRAYHIKLDQKVNKIILVPLSTWSNQDFSNIISFDFE